MLLQQSPLGGGSGRSALNTLHSTVEIGRPGGLQQQTQLTGLLGGELLLLVVF